MRTRDGGMRPGNKRDLLMLELEQHLEEVNRWQFRDF